MIIRTILQFVRLAAVPHHTVFLRNQSFLSWLLHLDEVVHDWPVIGKIDSGDPAVTKQATVHQSDNTRFQITNQRDMLHNCRSMLFSSD